MPVVPTSSRRVFWTVYRLPAKQVNVDAPMRATVKRTLNVAVWGNIVRIVLDPQESRWRGVLLKPSTILANKAMFYTDFRDAPPGNITAKTHAEFGSDDPDTDPVSGVGMKVLPGWTGRWMDINWHNWQAQTNEGALGETGAMAILTPETARDADHPSLDNYDPGGLYIRPPGFLSASPPVSGKMLRQPSGGFSAISLDAVSEHEGNVDLRVHFRFWEPMRSLVAPWELLFDPDGQIVSTGLLPGHYGSSSNQMMLILSMDSGTTEDNNWNEVYGYALRNNWVNPIGPGSWELVRFRGIQSLIEGQLASDLRETVFSQGSKVKGGITLPTYSIRNKSRAKVRFRKHVGIALETRPDERKIVFGDGITVTVISGVGEVLGPVSGFGRTAPGTWMWGRLQKTIDGADVHLKAELWWGDEDEPEAWGCETSDFSDEALQGGFTGIGTATQIGAEPGSFGQRGLQVGPADIDQVYVEVLQVKPGTSMSFKAHLIQCEIDIITPDFIVAGTPRGSGLVRTWWSEYELNQTPGDWFILRPGIGPPPDPSAVTNPDASGKPYPGDLAVNFLVKEDLDLDPVMYSDIDRSNRSLEHTTRDMTNWVRPDAEDPFNRFVNAHMSRDALAWNEPFPGADWLGQDGQIDDAEILMRFNADTWSQSTSIWLRASGAKGNETGYVVTPAFESGGPLPEEFDGYIPWTIYKYRNGEMAGMYGFGRQMLNGSEVRFGTFGWPWRGEDRWHWVRIRIEGSSEREAARWKGFPQPRDEWFSANNPLNQPHSMYPYGGVLIMMKFWADYEEESDVPWRGVIDDGFNRDPFYGFSGYHADWDENQEYLNRPYARYSPVAPPIDRGWFAVGGPLIGTTQRYAEASVHAVRIPVLDNSAYAGIHNLVSRATALGDASVWNAESVTISTVQDSTFEGGQGLELVGTYASADGAPVRVSSQERVPVEAGKEYIALATLHNFQHKWLERGIVVSGFQGWVLDKVRHMRVGLRWYDASGAEISTSMRRTFQSDRPPGSGPKFLGMGYQVPKPGQDIFYQPTLYPGVPLEAYDLNATETYGAPYVGYAFPADKKQPFRWQERWRWQVHGGAELIGDQPFEGSDLFRTTDNIGWAMPYLHKAPVGAVSAAAVVEVENTVITAYAAYGEYFPVVGYIGNANPRWDQYRNLGPIYMQQRDERYRIGEVAVFPALHDPRYESWQVKPGEFALPPAEVLVQATGSMPEPVISTFVVIPEPPTMEVDIVMPVVALHVTRPQYARPMQDLQDAGWTNEKGSPDFIWDSIDELHPGVVDDTDYAQSSQMAVDDTFQAQMTRLRNPDPDSDEAYVMHYRYRRRGLHTSELRVVLLQGTTEIASWQDEDLGKEFVTANQVLTQEQVDSITDYADLHIKLIGNVVPV